MIEEDGYVTEYQSNPDGPVVIGVHVEGDACYRRAFVKGLQAAVNALVWADLTVERQAAINAVGKLFPR